MLICIEQVICICVYLNVNVLCWNVFYLIPGLWVFYFSIKFCNVGNLIYFVYSFYRCVKYYIMWTVYNAGSVSPAFVSNEMYIISCSLDMKQYIMLHQFSSLVTSLYVVMFIMCTCQVWNVFVLKKSWLFHICMCQIWNLFVLSNNADLHWTSHL